MSETSDSISLLFGPMSESFNMSSKHLQMEKLSPLLYDTQITQGTSLELEGWFICKRVAESGSHNFQKKQKVTDVFWAAEKSITPAV